MKKLFLLILAVLVVSAYITVVTSRDNSSDCPVIVWKTDTNPQREEQVMLFREWLIKNGHILKDKNGEIVVYSDKDAAKRNREYGENGKSLQPGDPHYVAPGSPKPNGDILLESANNQSILIQAVSGMAGDLFDTGDIMGYSQLGVGVDITDVGSEHGFGLQNTYPGMAGILTGMDGRQYAYPCNGASISFWINMSTIEKYGMERPPLEWTPEEFERIGKEYVQRANEGLLRQDRFFCPALDSGVGVNMMTSILRSQGYDVFNETLTRSIFNTEAACKAFKLFHKWTYVDRLGPTAADVASMSAEAGFGGADFSNFASGKYAMIITGRWCLVRFREIQRSRNSEIKFGVSQMPMYEFKNHPLTVRAAMPYRGAKEPELAMLFLQFLASKEYNLYIVEKADGLPPNPAVVEQEMRDIVKTRPNESDSNEWEFKWAQDIALPTPRSPYVKTGATDWFKYGINQYFNNRASLEDAVLGVEERYNEEIEISKRANPVMKERWEQDWALQQKIDQYKQEGKKIPAQWIKNPFYLKYYREKGMVDENAPGEED